jgi:hypothetical protein
MICSSLVTLNMKKLVRNEFWGVVEPMLSTHCLGHRGGQASDDCAALREIIFMPQTGVPSWYMLPPETGPESGRDLLVSLARLANR